MNNDNELNVLEIDGKQYFLVDTIDGDKRKYYYFSNLKDKEDIQVLSDKKEDSEEFFVSLDTESELEYALGLFFEKYQNQV